MTDCDSPVVCIKNDPETNEGIKCKTDTDFIYSKTFDLDNPNDATFLGKSDTVGSIDFSEFTTFKDFNDLVVDPVTSKWVWFERKISSLRMHEIKTI